ncbi:S41 family peptidase [Alterisphingorhabdus coralli]|uniref:S41 family peptidase n=1 Tax=Alterisphingorhabdus coralli TaxID=3071408 RepID=A0AA97F7T1_9SPHN|nr:S41 family peptidase [Parasphingorhabdus sp. SCSIO 66989]WOE74858.1 S41 family peptidase [Parasphingorhabdus sp. SCSIO 66989]
MHVLTGRHINKAAKSLLSIIALASLPLPLAAQETQQENEASECDEWAASDSAWQDIEQALRENYAYLDRVSDHDALLENTGRNAEKADSLAELSIIVENLGYAFRDSHFHVSPAPPVERAWIPTGTDLWAARNELGKFMLIDVKADSDAYAKGLRPGMEILSIGGEPTADAVAKLLEPVTQSPSAEQLDYAVNVLLSGFTNTDRSIAVRQPDTTARLVTLAKGLSSYKRPKEPVTFKAMGETAYFRFNNQLGENRTIAAFDTLMGEHADAAAFIIDLRDTPSGGNTTVARAIMGHFVQQEAPYQQHINAYENDFLGVKRLQVEYVFPRQPNPSVPVVVLAGRWTGSVGEAIAMGMDSAANAYSIGTDLGDLLGTLNNHTLPNGCMTLNFAYDRLMHADGTRRENWMPDQILTSGETDAAGKDPALSAAYEYLASRNIQTR